MTQASYIDSLAASARCAAGEFSIAGRTLRPLSLTHGAILTALEIPLWIYGEPESNAEWLTVALICSQTGAAGLPEVIQFSSAKNREQKVAELIGNCDLDSVAQTWASYVQICHGSRPKLKSSGEDGGGAKYGAPFEEIVAGYILRNTSGYTRGQVMERLPASLVFWIFEAIREQESGVSHIYTDDEQAADEHASSAEEEARIAGIQTTATEISEIVTDQKKRLALLVKLNAGTLPKNWRKAWRAKK